MRKTVWFIILSGTYSNKWEEVDRWSKNVKMGIDYSILSTFIYVWKFP